MGTNSLIAKKIRNAGQVVGWAVFDGFMVAPIFKLIIQGDRYIVTDTADSEHPLTCHTFTTDGELFELRVLPEVREIYDAYNAELDRQADADIWAEGAWLRHAEYDPEAIAFQQWEDDRGVIPFHVELAMAYGARA